MRKAAVKQGACVLGIDLGTSALKIVAVSRDGLVIAAVREPYDTISTSEGQAEQDCEHWLRSLSRAAKNIRSRLAHKARVEAVALTGQMPTLVVLGSGQKPIGHAITWQDSRADRWVGERVDDSLRRDIYLKTGIRIDGRYLAPMFQYHHRKRKSGTVLSAKDFLFHILTGLAVTDPSTASGYGLYNLHTKAWDPELCKLWDIGAEQLPSVESSSFRAPLSKRGNKLLGCTPGTPVVLGCADSVAGAYAVGANRPQSHTATVLTGSSTVILTCDSEPRWDSQSRYLVTPLAVDGMYGREADLLASGSAREWAASVFLDRRSKKTRESTWRLAYRVASGANGLLFAPFLAGGEQGILWAPSLRGTITGLTLAHNGVEIARAMLEGMCFEIRRVLEVFEEGVPLSLIRAAGWMADVPEQSQLLADITGRPVHAFALRSAPAVGAALLSALIDGEKYFANTRAVVFTPTKQSPPYNELYAKYVAQFPVTGATAR
jgi:xylulokinase